MKTSTIFQLLLTWSVPLLCRMEQVSSFVFSHLHQRHPITSNNFLSAINNKNEDTPNDLLEKAKKLRQEVSTFQKGKEDKELAIQDERQRVLTQKQKDREQYSANVPILKGDGSTVMEQVDFPPRIKNSSSFILAVQASLPLGIILGEDEELPGAIRVDEVVEGSNGDIAGVKEGDLLRACTACQVSMEMPTWQLMAGGIGRPKTSRMMFSTDGRPFEEVMDAVGSNRMDPEERPAWLVLERMT